MYGICQYSLAMAAELVAEKQLNVMLRDQPGLG
jgi:hypothetical protein